MANSIGELALKMTLDAQQLTEGLVLSRDELKLHRAAMREAMTPADQFASSQRHLSQLMEQNPKNADQYRAALARLEQQYRDCLLYTSPSPRDGATSRMPSSA